MTEYIYIYIRFPLYVYIYCERDDSYGCVDVESGSSLRTYTCTSCGFDSCHVSFRVFTLASDLVVSNVSIWT